MPKKPQFSLRTLVLGITLIAAYLAMAQIVAREWQVVLVMAGATLVISLACLVTSGQPGRSLMRSLLVAVSIPSAALLAFGLHPGMYYMAGFFFAILLWAGVLIGSLLIAVTASAFSETAFSETGATGLRSKQVRAYLIIPLVTTLLLAFQVPLRLGAATAIPTLATHVSGEASERLVVEQRCGIYTVRLPGKRGTRAGQVYFVLADGSQTALVYSPHGMDDISYNPGSKGHLFGHWYWIAND